jgi:hypothetical protein
MTRAQIKQAIDDMRGGLDTKISGDELESVLQSIADTVTGKQTLTDGSIIPFNYANGAIGEVTISANRSIEFSNLAAGSVGMVIVKQDATGNRSLTFPAGSKIPTGGIALSTDANAYTIIGFVFDGVNLFLSKENY